jgi:glucose-1-phosphate thymidylyltransferase
LQYLLDNDVRDKGEYQLTNALENMKNKGIRFSPGTVTEWLDCGNKSATVYTNQRYLEFIADQKLIADSAVVTNSVIIPPVFIGEGVHITDSVIGPHVSVGEKSKLKKVVISNSIVQTNTSLSDSVIADSLIGSHVHVKGQARDLNLGDYSTES